MADGLAKSQSGKAITTMLLLVAVLTSSLIAPADSRQSAAHDMQQVAAMCSLSGERVGPQFKTCSYRCDDSGSFSLTVTKREICPFAINR